MTATGSGLPGGTTIGDGAGPTERDDGSVPESSDEPPGELPPPTGPPVGGAPAHQTQPFWADWDLPFGSFREAIEWWFRPLAEPRTWLSLAYLFVGAIVAVLRFVLVVVLLAISLPLVLVLIGVPLTVLSFRIVDALVGIERRRAAWVGEEIAPREFYERRGWWLRRLLTRFTDPTSWRQVAFVLVAAAVMPALFLIGALPLITVGQISFDLSLGPDIGGFTGLYQTWFNVGSIVVAALMLGLIGRLAPVFATAARSFVEWFVGPDRTAELEARVDSLSEQRSEILDAVSAERRRIERNLHDGVQQQLVAIGIDIGRAEARLAEDPDAARRLLEDARDKVRGSVGELRMIGRGLHPAVLDDRGLDAALSSIVAGSPIPIDVVVEVDGPIPTAVAETAYYIANEAVANVLKHARARAASIRVVQVRLPEPALSLSVRDDGRGGASIASGGSGLAGMAARVHGVDGSFAVDSPVGGPTVIDALIPLRGGGRDG